MPGSKPQLGRSRKEQNQGIIQRIMGKHMESDGYIEGIATALMEVFVRFWFWYRYTHG